MEEKRDVRQQRGNALVPEMVNETPGILAPTQVSGILRKTPEEFVKYRKGRSGKTLAYVETNYVISQLNSIFGFMWDVEVLYQTPEDLALKIGQVVTRLKLTVKDTKGNFISKTAVGGSEIKYLKGKPHIPANLVDLADDYKTSESDALKKAASMLGICLDVYSGEFSRENEEEKPEEPVQNETQRTFHMTERQRKYLFKLCMENSIDEDLLHSILETEFGKTSLKEISSRKEFEKLLDVIDPKGKDERQRRSEEWQRQQRKEGL